MTRTLDVGIIGIGTAGAAAATLLARQGHRVTVFERVDKPTAVGAGIILQPTGLYVLSQLGLFDDVLAHGAPITKLVSETSRGRVVLDLAYAALGATPYTYAQGLGTHRGVLFRALHDACVGNATVRTGVEITDVRLPRRGKREVVDAHGVVQGAFDLVLVCDGARSTVRRRQHELPWSSTPYPWGALWVIHEDPERAFRDRLYQVVDGTANMIGLLPTGLGPHGDVPLVSLFISVPLADVPAIRARGIDALRAHVLALCPKAAPVLEGVTSLDAFTTAEYHDVVMPRWHAPGLAFMGDAAHATSPQLGQGCNLALCDAWTLACCIENAHKAGESVDAALSRYTDARRDHLGYYQPVTRLITPFFQSHAEPLAWLRDIFMGPAGRIPWVAREMVRTMAGIKSGFLMGQWPRDPS